MCGQCDGLDLHRHRSRLSRRAFVGSAVGAAAMSVAFGAQARPVTSTGAQPLVVADGLSIMPREAWGSDLPPKGPLESEDVRFLLVHHTATSNSIPDQRQLIRNIFAFHTSGTKGWNDVAYNFFVGPDGTVWEGRAGSMAGPVQASATGGNQGYAQLVCLLGDFSQVPPTAAMQQSLVRLLAHLSVRYDLSTWKDATASFISRGSNKWSAGRSVAARTISGHRDMTYTACPGNAAYSLLDQWRRDVHQIVAQSWKRDGLQVAQRQSLVVP